MTQIQKYLQISCLFLLLCTCTARKHKLKVENDARKKIDLTTFGFLKGGELAINLTNFVAALQYPTENSVFETTEYSFGFTLDKTSTSGISPDLEGNDQTCIFQDDKIKKDKSVSIVFFRMDLKSNPPRIKIERKGDDLNNLQIFIPTAKEFKEELSKTEKKRTRRSLDFLSDSYLFSRKRRAVEAPKQEGKSNPENETKQKGVPPPKPAQNTVKSTTSTTTKPVSPDKKVSLKSTTVPGTTTPAVTTTTSTVAPVKEERVGVFANDTIPLKLDPKTNRYSVFFLIWITNETEAGLYNLFYHNCDNYNNEKNNRHKIVNFTIRLAETNYDGVNYLSAGDIPLPKLYLAYSTVYFTLAVFWFYIVKRATEGVFRTHYMMLVFLFVKSISMFFHSINFYFIQKQGHHEAAFAILFYITYLMKGTLLFVTIVLIGAGWAFVKHILSDRDKKIFVIVIPLQVLANVAQIIIEETEEGQSQYLLWKQLFIMLDLLCCGAILFPVVWSIRHLQDASQTDGKAAINLVKLKIFRHFYILIVCYIYFTRIIVYLLAMTVPFQYDWVCVVFKETATLFFFVLTGYKFRPASDNPYLQIPQEEDDVEMEEVLTESGVTEGLTRVNIRDPSTDNKSTAGTVKQRESSHEYD